MELQDLVRKDHVVEALRLFNNATVQASQNHRQVEVGENEKEDVKKAELLIKTRVAIGSKIKRDQLIRYLQDQDVEAGAAKKALHLLVMKQTLEETTGNSYKRMI